MNRGMQLHYFPVTAFSLTNLYLDRVCLELVSRVRAMTSHKGLIDVTASLDRNRLSFTKEKVY